MTKEIYDFITAIGVTCLNWPTKNFEESPIFLKFVHNECTFTLHKDCTPQQIINELGKSNYKMGFEQGKKQGKHYIQHSIKELLGINET